MSCSCPVQPDYCVDEPVTALDCWECPTCRTSMTAVDLGVVLRHKDRLIERLHATRSTLMEERNSAMSVADELRRQLTGEGYSIILPWETDLRQLGTTLEMLE